MEEQDVFAEPDFKKCVAFHGHICPGLATGYRAAKAGLAWLEEHRAADEEIVAIVETDSCGTDAVQVLTGCTFGKGNFLYLDHGKMAFTFLSRKTGRGVRVARLSRFSPAPEDERHGELMKAVRSGSATPEEREAFRRLHHEKAAGILGTPTEDLFSVEPVERDLPPRAVLEPSRPCAACGEPVMASRLTEQDGKELCKACL